MPQFFSLAPIPAYTNPMSVSNPIWTPRHNLALPNELLHKIIVLVLCNSVHSICTSCEDTTWEKNMMSILHQVSPAFKAISSEIATKAFDISRDVRNDDEALLRTLSEIFVYLSDLGVRFRHPSEWGNISFRTIDCSASSFVYAYALYLSCTSLRRNACRSPRDVFESTHKVILSALEQSDALCERVRPPEITSLLKGSIDQEYELAILGVKVIQALNDLQEYANALALFQLHVAKDGTGPVAGARSLIHSALLKVEGSYEVYEAILNKMNSRLEPRIYELPGVLRGLRRIATLTIDQDQFDLRDRIQKIVKLWSAACPFLNKVDLDERSESVFF